MVCEGVSCDVFAGIVSAIDFFIVVGVCDSDHSAVSSKASDIEVTENIINQSGIFVAVSAH